MTDEQRAITPWSRYQADLARGFLPDPAQERAVRATQALYERLLAPRPGGLLQRLRRRPQPVRGLYLWGGVGRGKTYLMDCFQECLPETLARRIHFHRFMEDVHDRLRACGALDDPLARIGRDLARDRPVLCFDEFFVADIADAMILSRLLEAMFAEAMTLVATSNVPPAELYRDGLQRAKFLPAIALIERHCDVLEVGGETDYRLRILSRDRTYLAADDGGERALDERFGELAPGAWTRDSTIRINQRPIRVRALADGLAWFDFAELCDTPRSASDYIEIARRFNTVFVSAIPVLGEGRNDPARRFIHLVDELYDRNVNLMVSAEAPIDSLYDGERLAFEFQRARSRLAEMQTHAYLAREHRP